MNTVAGASPSAAVLKKMIPKNKWGKMLADIWIGKDILNKLVMNYFLFEGYAETAETFVQETGILSDWDLTNIKERLLIRKTLMKGEVEEAIQKINDMNPEILGTNPLLLFHLQLQRFIELIRQGDTDTALNIGVEEIRPLLDANLHFLDEMGSAMMLLLDDLNTCPYKELLSQAQRNRRASEVNAAILARQTQNRETEPKLEKLLKMLIWTESELQKTTDFPRILDLSKATVKDPST